MQLLSREEPIYWYVRPSPLQRTKLVKAEYKFLHLVSLTTSSTKYPGVHLIS